MQLSSISIEFYTTKQLSRNYINRQSRFKFDACPHEFDTINPRLRTPPWHSKKNWQLGDLVTRMHSMNGLLQIMRIFRQSLSHCV